MLKKLADLLRKLADSLDPEGGGGPGPVRPPAPPPVDPE